MVEDVRKPLSSAMQSLDLAAIGNCAIASLITKTGRHVWFCYPKLDGDPVFNALVNGEAPERGYFDVELSNAREFKQTYLPNTAILETIAFAEDGSSVKIIDFAPRHERYGRSFHPQLLVRRIIPLSGRPRIRVKMRPTFEYGAVQPTLTTGSNHVRYVGPQAVVRVTADMPVSYVIDETEFTLDRPVNLFIGVDEPVPDNLETLAASFLGETQTYWWRWARGLSIPFEWQDETIRSAITLKLCSYEDTGAIVAALTTSLPEAPGSQRNWDYRFCWLRDAYFTVGALNRLGATRTMEGFIRFVLDAVLAGERRGVIPPLFTLSGTGSVDERFAKDLSGYQNMGPVRVGNAAAIQVQNDCFGSIILTATQMFYDRRLVGSHTATLYEQLRNLGHMAVANAFENDAGPWEYRGRKHVHTYSAAMCWAAVHRLSMIAEKLGIADEAQTWRSHAQAIRKQLLERATTKSGWISGVLDGEFADASTLLLPEIGLLKADDARFLKTLDVTAERLLKDGYVYRYHEADDFGRPETAFLVCTFWYCDALALAGRKDEARELFSHVLACRNSVGLLSEDVVPQTRALWGNFPQAYSHVGLIHSASRLSRGWEEALWRAS